MKNESSGFAPRFPWMCCEGHKFGNQVLWVPSKGFYKGVHGDNEKENGSYYLRCIIRVSKGWATLSAVLIIRLIVYWGLYRGPFISGNCQVNPANHQNQRMGEL